ncbi:terminase [Metarhizobium album]|uniref:Terminase n=1 Tax=Metarhizobium album TaxID=2182425 RepID=A0A2U2DV15_9HYPH|nr:terminase [Rhizobium album]PWE57144.1 terminase [Rhizobium album]
MNDMARKLALLGLTDAEMAEFFGVTERTFNNWKDEFPAFFQSLNEGKTIADANVADSLYRRAVGEVVFVEKRVKGKDGEYEIIRLSQQIPADPGAAKLWLTNRRPQQWREKQEIDHKSSDGSMTPVRVELVALTPNADGKG